MLLLASTSDKLQVVNATTADFDVHASWADYNGTTVTPGRTNTAFTTNATNDVVASPASSTYRNVKTLVVRNVHASTSSVVTVRHTDGTTPTDLWTGTLLAGESVEYAEGSGFVYRDASGFPKAAPLAVGSYLVARLASTVSNSTTTAAKITGLDTPTGTGTFVFEYFIRFQSATGTVGFKLGCNYTGTVTTFDYTLAFPQTNTVDSAGTMDQDITAAPTVMATLAARGKTTSAPLISIGGVDTTASDILVLVSGLMVVTAAGNLELYHASETATSTSIMLDSVLRVTKMG